MTSAAANRMIGVGVADKVNGTWTDLLVPAGHGASSFAPAKMKANHMNQSSSSIFRGKVGILSSFWLAESRLQELDS